MADRFFRIFFKILAVLYFNLVIKNRKKRSYIPVSGNVLEQDDLCYMIDSTLDMWLTTGRYNEKFEKEFAKTIGVKYALTTTSGSSANLLALSALTSYKLQDKSIKKGDEVITVAAGFPTTVVPILQNELVPVFVDCEIGTYNIDVSKIEKAISPKTKAIMIAHTLGNMFDTEKIQEICQKYDLWLIEDTCDALGAEFNGQKAGSIGDIGTFSFYPAHHITMGEGGAVVTNDENLYKILKSFRDWGRDCTCPTGYDGVCGKRFSQQFGKMPFGFDHKYIYSHAGYNLKITDMQAAIGLSQLKKLPKFLKKREENAKLLYEKLSDLAEYFIFPKVAENVKSSWFGFLLTIKEGQKFTKQEIVTFLEQNRVGTRQLFAGNILRQPMFVENAYPLRINNSNILVSCEIGEEEYKMLPNTEYIMNNTFWVGCFPGLGKEEIEKISNLIHKFVESAV